MENKCGLIVVDLQNDFCPGGTLGVPDGDSIIPTINKYIEYFFVRGFPIIFTRDWHPPDTKHFVPQGGPWPIHCVQETPGAAFAPDVIVPPASVILSKGTSADADGYSAFSGMSAQGKRLIDVLHTQGIRTLLIGGLATDYCVKATTLDARKHGFNVYILMDAIKEVNVNPGDADAAIAEMTGAGARQLQFSQMTEVLG